jgi:hypothetical protein
VGGPWIEYRIRLLNNGVPVDGAFSGIIHDNT